MYTNNTTFFPKIKQKSYLGDCKFVLENLNKAINKKSKKVGIQTNKYLDRMMDRQYDANTYFFNVIGRIYHSN